MVGTRCGHPSTGRVPPFTYWCSKRARARANLGQNDPNQALPVCGRFGEFIFLLPAPLGAPGRIARVAKRPKQDRTPPQTDYAGRQRAPNTAYGSKTRLEGRRCLRGSGGGCRLAPCRRRGERGRDLQRTEQSLVSVQQHTRDLGTTSKRNQGCWGARSRGARAHTGYQGC